MPADTMNYDNIRKLQESAASTVKQGAGVEAAAGTLGDKVMEAVRKDRIERGVSKLATDTGNVMGQMVTDPNAIRETASPTVDPFSVNALTSSARAQNLRTLGTISTQEEQNQGSIDQVIQAGANQLKARAAQLYAQAQEEAAKAKAMEDEWSRNLEERKFTASQASSGGTDNSWIYDLINGKDNNTNDGFVEDKNTSTPAQPTSQAGFVGTALGEIFNPIIQTLTGSKAKAKERNLMAMGYTKQRYGPRGAKVRWVDKNGKVVNTEGSW